MREHIWKTANGAATATDGFPLEPPARRSMPWKNAGLRVSHPPPTSYSRQLDCAQPRQDDETTFDGAQGRVMNRAGV